MQAGCFWQEEEDAAGANEYLQVGYKVFDSTNPAAANAKMFALFKGVLKGLDVRAGSGNIGILMAPVTELKTTQRYKAVLMWHIWQARWFRVPMEWFWATLLAKLAPLDNLPPIIGLRICKEIGT